MKRRQVLIQVGSVLLVLPASRLLGGCGGSTPDRGSTPPANEPPQGSGTGDAPLRFTSTVVDGHTHALSLERSNLQSPPSGGLQSQTTSAAGHVHVVELTEADLRALQSGQVVTKTTTSNAGHTHQFELSATSVR